MQNSLGLLFLLAFWVFGFVVIRRWNKNLANTRESFLLSNRGVGLALGAVSAATAWVWAPALFVASQKAYEQGVPGLFWFTFPNAMALVLFSFLAARMKKIFARGYTLPEYARIRFDGKTQILYMAAIFVIQVYSVVLQVTAALLLLSFLTGIEKPVLVVALGLIIGSLSLMRGFRSSLAADVIKASLIAVVGILIVPWAVHQSGGLSNVLHGIGGISGNFKNLFDGKVAMAFGIPISVSLLSGIVIDQQQWQRTFAMRRETVRKSFLLAAALFVFVPLLLGILGFAAAGAGVAVGAGQAQLVGVFLVRDNLPQIGILAFSLMVVAGLVAAGMAALSAAGSVGAVDLYRLFSKDVSDKKTVLVSRVTMAAVLLIAVTVALIPNIQIVYLVLLIGVFRASLMVPTILSLYWSKLSANFTFAGIVLGMAMGVPLFVYGSITKNATVSSFGSLVPILVSTVFCIAGALRKHPRFAYEKFNEPAAESESA